MEYSTIMLKFRKIFLFALLLTFSMTAVASTNPFGAEKTLVVSLNNVATTTPATALTKKQQREVKKQEKLIRKIEKAKAGSKSWVAALLLCFFLGGLGIHRFYLGYTWQGVVQLLTLGGLGIWVLIDFIRIIIKDLQPNGGSYDK